MLRDAHQHSPMVFSVFGKDYIAGSAASAALGEYERTLNVCKGKISPQAFGLYAADVAWYKSYINNPSEQEAYKNAFDKTTPQANKCQKLSYDA